MTDDEEANGLHPPHHLQHPEHCINQIATRALKNGDLLAVFNEERFPFHHDSGQTLMARSKDGGKTWGPPSIVLPWMATREGNWDCGICELADGTLIVNNEPFRHLASSSGSVAIKAEQRLVASSP